MNKKQNIYNYIAVLLLIIYNFTYQFVVIKKYINIESIITSIFFIGLFVVSVLAYGFCRSKLNPTKKKASIRVGGIVILAIAVTYGIGVLVGFLRNGYSLTLINIIRNTYAPIFIVIFTELFRYNFIRANKNKFRMIVIITILLTILEIQMNMAIISVWGVQEIFVFVTTLVIPIVAKNMLMGYLSYEAGYQPCLIYRLILELYIYFVPYVPRFGDYLNSMFGLILPLVVFVYASDEVEYEKNIVSPEFLDKKSKWVKLPIYAIVFIYIALISRIFPAFMIGIGSDSMTGTMNKGDAAIAIRVKEENIQVDDVIVFQTQDKILIHRVVEIENIDGINHYRTKGDVNSSRDNVDVTMDKIYGKVKFRIPYLSYPSVWFSEFIKEHK